MFSPALIEASGSFTRTRVGERWFPAEPSPISP